MALQATARFLTHMPQGDRLRHGLLAKGADDDGRVYFPDSAAVNCALRSLIDQSMHTRKRP